MHGFVLNFVKYYHDDDLFDSNYYYAIYSLFDNKYHYGILSIRIWLKKIILFCSLLYVIVLVVMDDFFLSSLLYIFIRCAYNFVFFIIFLFSQILFSVTCTLYAWSVKSVFLSLLLNTCLFYAFFQFLLLDQFDYFLMQLMEIFYVPLSMRKKKKIVLFFFLLDFFYCRYCWIW